VTVHGRISDAYLDLVYSALPMLGAEGTTPAKIARAINGAKPSVSHALRELVRQGRCVRFEYQPAPCSPSYHYFRAPQEQP